MIHFTTDIFLQVTQDALFALDPRGRIIFWNGHAEKLTGLAAEDVLGQVCGDNLMACVDEKGKSRCETCALRLCAASLVENLQNMYVRHRDGHRVLVHVRTADMTTPSGEHKGVLGSFAQVCDPARFKAEISKAAADPVTGLADRPLLEVQLESEIKQAVASGSTLTVFLMELRGLAEINHSFGFTAGDQVLREVALTVEGSVPEAQTVGRWRGNQFMGTIRSIMPLDMRGLGERILSIVQQTVTRLGENQVGPRAAIGLSAGSTGIEMETLLVRVEHALARSEYPGESLVQVDMGGSTLAFEGEFVSMD